MARRISQCLCQAPTVQRQQYDVEHEYGQKMKYKRIGDEGDVAAYGNDPKIDHVLHGKSRQYKRRSDKSNFAATRHDLHSPFQFLHAQMKKFGYSSIRRIPVSKFQKHPVALHLAFGTCQSCVIQPLSYLAKEAEDFFSLSHEDCHSLSPTPCGLGPQIVAF